MYNTKNYNEQGGEKTVIGGTLEIKEGATVTGVITAEIVDNLTTNNAGKALSAKQGKVLKDTADALAITVSEKLDTPAENQAESTAEDVAGLVTDFNALLTKLKMAGLMVAD